MKIHWLSKIHWPWRGEVILPPSPTKLDTQWRHSDLIFVTSRHVIAEGGAGDTGVDKGTVEVVIGGGGYGGAGGTGDQGEDYYYATNSGSEASRKLCPVHKVAFVHRTGMANYGFYNFWGCPHQFSDGTYCQEIYGGLRPGGPTALWWGKGG